MPVKDSEVALAYSYLRRLHRSGYFGKDHSMSDGVWFDDHPACCDGETWKRVTDLLVDNGYLTIERLPEEKVRNLHPKDQLDAWWFRLTPDGAALLGKP